MFNSQLQPQQYQQGIASLELVLFLPIFLILMLLSIHLTKMMHTRMEIGLEARNAAMLPDWITDSALFELGATRYGLPKHRSASPASSGKAWDMVADMRAAGSNSYSDSRRLTAVLDRAQSPLNVGRAWTLYRDARLGESGGGIGGWFFSIEAQLAVLRGGFLTRGELPLGYDNFMHERLKPRALFVEFFPCQSGNASSATKAEHCRGE